MQLPSSSHLANLLAPSLASRHSHARRLLLSFQPARVRPKPPHVVTTHVESRAVTRTTKHVHNGDPSYMYTWQTSTTLPRIMFSHTPKGVACTRSLLAAAGPSQRGQHVGGTLGRYAAGTARLHARLARGLPTPHEDRKPHSSWVRWKSRDSFREGAGPPPCMAADMWNCLYCMIQCRREGVVLAAGNVAWLGQLPGTTQGGCTCHLPTPPPAFDQRTHQLKPSDHTLSIQGLPYLYTEHPLALPRGAPLSPPTTSLAAPRADPPAPSQHPLHATESSPRLPCTGA